MEARQEQVGSKEWGGLRWRQIRGGFIMKDLFYSILFGRSNHKVQVGNERCTHISSYSLTHFNVVYPTLHTLFSHF